VYVPTFLTGYTGASVIFISSGLLVIKVVEARDLNITTKASDEAQIYCVVQVRISASVRCIRH
jgi:hypothetical protein